MKLIALYSQPADPAAFDEWYFNQHVPLVHNLNGLKSASITKFSRTLAGDGFYLMAVMDFGDADTFKAAMRSPEMGAVGADAQAHASDIMTLMIGADQ